MSRLSPGAEFTNMVMIQNPKTGDVLVQHRRISWKGLAFPGGHTEVGESFYNSAVREIKEETGLDVKNLKCCGIVHWCNTESGIRYIVYLYRTSDYSGELINATDEGEVFWTSLESLKASELSPNMEKYLDIFTSDSFTEFFGSHDGQKDRKYTYTEC